MVSAGAPALVSDILSVVIELLVAHCGKDKLNEKELLKVDNLAKLDVSIDDMLLNVSCGACRASLLVLIERAPSRAVPRRGTFSAPIPR